MSRRRVLAYLAALSVLFSQGYCSISASESALHTTPELTSEDYELTSFSGIFGMSEEEKAKTIDSFGRVRLLEIKINRETIIIPSVYYKMKVIRDEDKNNSENSSAIRRGLGIALGDLQQLDFVPADYVPESEHVKMYNDLISGEAIVIEEDTDTSRKMLNRNYIKEKFAQNLDYEVSIKDSSLELAMGYYQKQTLENNNFGFNEDIYENPQTLERFFTSK